MKFEDYQKRNELIEVCKTEQSEVFLNGNNRICKHYFNKSDQINEFFFYNFFGKENLINIPRLFLKGEDFIEIELLDRQEKINLSRTVDDISCLYKRTKNVRLHCLKVDLSKEKLLYRIGYLKEEIKKRRIDSGILENAKSFVIKEYSYCPEDCVVHGDLKSPHIFQDLDKTKFVDFALTGIANPWYDLSFLCMEEQEDKESVFDQVVDFSFFNLRDYFELNQTKTKGYLLSSMFYRTLYLFGFALRHRPQKSLDRIVKELNDIMDRGR